MYTRIPWVFHHDLQQIQPRLDHAREDGWTWSSSDTGGFSVKAAYTWLYDQQYDMNATFDGRWIWKLKVPEKLRVFV